MTQEADIQAENDRLRADIQKVSQSLIVYHAALRQIQRGGVTPEDVRGIVNRALSVWPGEK